jgi:hypothetical protein
MDKPPSLPYDPNMLNFHAFQPSEHAVMLADQVRLDAFFKAISNQIQEGMTVVEVGTGTGILSAFAASRTQSPVYAIEHDEYTVKLAKTMMEKADLKQVKILQGKSFDLELPTAPDALITETIGAIGPEENIVEICFDLKKRYPSLRSFIPSRLRVFAEPVSSKEIRDSSRIFFEYLDCASFGTFDYKAIRPELEIGRCSHVLYGSIRDAKSVAPRALLAEYVLGESESPTFSKEVDLTGMGDAEAVHLYFEAVLDETVLLSTHYSQPETHWRHAYVTRPNLQGRLADKLTVGYSAGDLMFHVEWATS